MLSINAKDIFDQVCCFLKIRDNQVTVPSILSYFHKKIDLNDRKEFNSCTGLIKVVSSTTINLL